MIFVLAVLLLAVVGAPVFALLAWIGLVEFAAEARGGGFAAATIEALGRRCLGSPALVGVALLVVCVRLLGVSPAGARLRRVVGSSGSAYALAVLFYGVVAELPMRALVLAALPPAGALAVGSALIGRDAGARLASLAQAKWEIAAALVSAAALVTGALQLHEVAVIGVLGAMLGGRKARSLAVLRPVCVQASSLLGMWLLVVVAAVGVVSWLEQSEIVLWSDISGYRAAVVVGLGAELVRLVMPTAEHAAAAYLGERYGSPMPLDTRRRVMLVLAVLALCASVPGVTGFLPRQLGRLPLTAAAR